jgi:hypothetical protein
MKRSFIILFGALALGTAIFAGSYFIAQRATVMCCVNPADDLSWLRMEFHLSDAEMARIRQLHDGYKPKCEEICAQIARQQQELQTLLGDSTNLPVAAQAKLNVIAMLRAQCQSNMLQHFVTVSRAMPPAQGARYLAEMKRLTLGFHEQTEQSMAGDADHEHRH